MREIIFENGQRVAREMSQARADALAAVVVYTADPDPVLDALALLAAELPAAKGVAVRAEIEKAKGKRK
tara:strand:- start:1760 stop:1966 length:207 start_codon:yes stop_codon:yes gene_type:complete